MQIDYMINYIKSHYGNRPSSKERGVPISNINWSIVMVLMAEVYS